MLAILDELRWALVPTWLDAAGMTAEGSGAPDAATRLVVRGWLVGLEEVAMVWDPQQVSQQELVDRLVDSFFAFGRDSTSTR